MYIIKFNININKILNKKKKKKNFKKKKKKKQYQINFLKTLKFNVKFWIIFNTILDRI